MNKNTLPANVVAEDVRLEGAAQQAQEALTYLRWHWTLDQSNPARVSFRQYARDTHRDDSTIGRYVNGYVAWIEQESAGASASTHLSLSDHIRRAGRGAEKQAAAEAIAKAEGSTVANVLTNRRDAVKAVIAHAEDRADRSGTTTEQELEQVAQWQAMAKKADADRAAKRKRQHSLQYIHVDGLLFRAKKAVQDALTEMHEVEFAGEEMELLEDTLAKLKAVVHLLDMRIVGTADVDWDAELAKMGEVR